MTETKYTTFWNILNNIGIEIPAIQRDYAQGREVGRIPIIRKKFINTLLSAIEDNTPTRLDFIYGKIYGEKNIEELRKNTHSIKSLLDSIREYADSIDLIVSENDIVEKGNNKGETVFLIPLDGQQRLTALFLIHWFINSNLEKNGCYKNLQQLKRFRYKTRKSTELFIEMLCDETVSFNFTKNLYEEIVNHERFSTTWQDDPTVKSMLVVINEIQHYFNNKEEKILPEDYSSIWKNLTEKEILHFDFLNLKDFSLSDDLYVKMNARGKELSDFENFKAWLIGKIQNEEWLKREVWDEYSLKFDVEWNDLFWDQKSENVYEIDDAYFNYFKILYLTNLVSEAKIVKSAFKAGEINDVIESIIKNSPDFDFEKNYDETFKNQLEKYFDIVDFCGDDKLKSEKNISAIQEFKEFLFNGTSEISWTDLIKNYIIISFIDANSKDELNEFNFNSYFRVLSNLFNNQTFDSASLYQNAINDINKINEDLVGNDYNIYDWLIKLDEDTYSSVFRKGQIKEEILKSSLIYQGDQKVIDEQWLALIEEAESHEYFNGKIGFLLKFSNQDKNLFRKYLDQISPLFKSEILNIKNYLLQRSLLTFGNYFGSKGSDKVSFFKNDNTSYRSRRENWLVFLMDNNQNLLLKNLVDDELYDKNNVVDSLNKIIDRFIENNSEIDMINKNISNIDYYKLYIYCPDLFKYGSSNLIQLAHKKYAYQLNATNTGGYFNDVLLEYIKKNYFETTEKVEVHKTLGWDNSPNIVIENKRIRVVAKNNSILVEEVENDDVIVELNTLQELINFIEMNLISNND